MLFSTKLSVVAAFAAVANAQLTVNTPAALIQCQPASLSWSGAEGPFFVSILPGGEASATPLDDLGEVQSSPLSYTVAVAAGTSVTVRVIDGSGNPQYSEARTVQAGSDGCLNSSSGSSSAAASASASESGASSSGSASASQSQSGSPSASASGAGASSTGNGASALTIGSAAGVAGIIAAVMGIVA